MISNIFNFYKLNKPKTDVKPRMKKLLNKVEFSIQLIRNGTITSHQLILNIFQIEFD